MFTQIDNAAELIDFPVNILSFNGKVEINNKNFKWVKGGTRKCDFEKGITVCVLNSGSENYAKSFVIYNIDKRETGERWVFTRKFIVRGYSCKEYAMNTSSWIVECSGYTTEEDLNRVNLVYNFMRNYIDNYKV